MNIVKINTYLFFEYEFEVINNINQIIALKLKKNNKTLILFISKILINDT